MPSFLPQDGANTTVVVSLSGGASARLALSSEQIAETFGGPKYDIFWLLNRSTRTFYVRSVSQAEVDAGAPVTIDPTHTPIPPLSAFEWKRRDDEVALDVLSAAGGGGADDLIVTVALPTGTD